MKNLFKIYHEGEQIPHTFTVGRKYVGNDRAPTWFMVIPHVLTVVRSYHDPVTFQYHPNALVRKLYMFRLRFPQYKKFLFTKQTTYILVKKDANL